MDNFDITVIFPALNESGNLKVAVEGVIHISQECSLNIEIIIVNDGSRDGTAEIAKQLADVYHFIRVIHHEFPQGMGYCYRKGLELAKAPFLTFVPGNNLVEAEAIKNMFASINRADMILLYINNPTCRSFFRRFVSTLYVNILNLLFNLHIRYYNGPTLLRTNDVKQVTIPTGSHAYMSAILVQLLKKGRSYYEIGMQLNPRVYGKSYFFSLRNLSGSLKTLFFLLINGWASKTVFERFLNKANQDRMPQKE